MSAFYTLPPPTYYSNFKNFQSQEYPILEFQNGVYQGDLKEYKRDGRGIYLWDTGQIYIGNWHKDSIQGLGIVYFAFGGTLVGLFEKNKMNGPGILKMKNGDIYGGVWKEGKMERNCIKYTKAQDVWNYLKTYDGFILKTEGTPKERQNIMNEFEKIKDNIYNKLDASLYIEEVWSKIPILMIKNNPNNVKNIIGYIDLNSKHENYWYFGQIYKGVANGIGLLFFEDKLCSSGVFQEGRLDGLGTKQTLEGDIYDGVFVKGELFLGVYYNSLQKEFYFALFDNKEPKKIYCSGNGFPFEIQKVYKHNVYQPNLSYYYKYTSSKLIYFKELDREYMIKFGKECVPLTERKRGKKNLSQPPSPINNPLKNKAPNLKRDTLRDPTTLILHRDKKSLFNALNTKSVLKNHIPITTTNEERKNELCKLNETNRRETLYSDRETTRKFEIRQIFELNEEGYYNEKVKKHDDQRNLSFNNKNESINFDFQETKPKFYEEQLFSFSNKNDNIYNGNDSTIKPFNTQQKFHIEDTSEVGNNDYKETIKKAGGKKQEQLQFFGFKNENQSNNHEYLKQSNKSEANASFNNFNFENSHKFIKFDDNGFNNSDENDLLKSYENQQSKVKFQKMELLRDSSSNKSKWGKLKRDDSVDKMNVKVAEYYESNSLLPDYGEESIQNVGNSNFFFAAREKKYSLIY